MSRYVYMHRVEDGILVRIIIGYRTDTQHIFNYRYIINSFCIVFQLISILRMKEYSYKIGSEVWDGKLLQVQLFKYEENITIGGKPSPRPFLVRFPSRRILNRRQWRNIISHFPRFCTIKRLCEISECPDRPDHRSSAVRRHLRCCRLNTLWKLSAHSAPISIVPMDDGLFYMAAEEHIMPMYLSTTVYIELHFGCRWIMYDISLRWYIILYYIILINVW